MDADAVKRQHEVCIGGKEYRPLIDEAVRSFWATKREQLAASGDTTNRGAVVAGKQMDGFLELLRTIAVGAGVRPDCIITKNNYLPGYYRSSKDWDMLIISPSGKLVAAIELKSQVGSYGNNFNNRTEEAIGSAVDLWTAYREGQFPDQGAPWLGWLMLVGWDTSSTHPVRNNSPHFPVRAEFDGASYVDRYRIFCQKLITERLYTSTALVCTNEMGDYGDVPDGISIASFLRSFAGFLIGVSHEFE